jgi:protein-disulfide isomerase
LHKEILATHLDRGLEHNACKAHPARLNEATDEGVEMRKIYALIILVMTLSALARSQTPTADPTPPPSPVNQAAAQSSPVVDDCACESQILPEAAAVVNGVKITSKDLKKATGESVSRLQQQVIDARKRELDLMINSRLLALEAKNRGITTTKLLEQEVVSKVKRPTTAEGQAFYDQNKARIKGEFAEVADDILNYLVDQREREAAKKFADGLREVNETKVLITNVTAPKNEAERARVLATIKGEPITSGDLEDSLKALIFDVQEQVYKLRKEELDLTINDTLLTQEAARRKITTAALLDAEIKPQAVTDEQIRTFFEQNKQRISGDLTQTKDAIKQYLEQIEVRRSEAAYVEKLRAAASIQTFLIAPESPVFSISTTDQPSLGKDNAPVTIIAFTDYQCPSCASMHPSLERVVKEYGDKVRLVTRDFPLTQHVDAFKAAEAAEAAREQGKYWEYIQVLLKNQSLLTVEKLKGYATEVGLDRTRFDSALDSGKFKESVQLDIDDGIRLGLKGTPTLFINGRRVSVKSYEDLKALVDAALKNTKATASLR